MVGIDEFSNNGLKNKTWVPSTVSLNKFIDKKNNSHYCGITIPFKNAYDSPPEKLVYYITTDAHGKKHLWLDQVIPDFETLSLSRADYKVFFVIVNIVYKKQTRLRIPRQIIKHLPQIAKYDKLYFTKHYVPNRYENLIRWEIILNEV